MQENNKRLIKKINWEYQMFTLGILSTSRENIFTKSREIELKKQIYNNLKMLLVHEEAITDSSKIKLCMKENVLEYIFLKLHEVEAITAEEIQKCLKEDREEIC